MKNAINPNVNIIEDVGEKEKEEAEEKEARVGEEEEARRRAPRAIFSSSVLLQNWRGDQLLKEVECESGRIFESASPAEETSGDRAGANGKLR